MTDQFVHLHVHDEYSMLDGAADTARLVSRAVELGQPAIAQTNHGNLFGTFRFHKECIAQGIRPILGMEAYCAPYGTRATERDKVEGYSGAGAYSHLTLLAKNSAGLRNLYRLTSWSYSDGFYQKPRIDLEELERNRDGLIIGSGCLSGELLIQLEADNQRGASAYVGEMKERFGDAFFIEVMDHGFDRETKHIRSLLEIANRWDIRCVATNDSHYISAGDSLLHDAMLCLQTFSTLDSSKRMRFDGDGYYIKTRAQMEVLGLPREALDNSLWVAEQVEDYTEAFTGHLRMPEYADAYGKPEELLRHKVKVALESMIWRVSEPHKYEERTNYELDVICAQGFPAYFLVLADIVGWAKSMEISVGPGRGSAAASLVAYLLDITTVDPLVHGLLFERFLNADRVSLPDVDIDFESARRDEVIAYATEKYGREMVSRIGTIGTIAAKKALRDSARVLGRSFDVGTRLTRCLPPPDSGGRMPGLSEADMSKVDDGEVFQLAERLEGLARAPGVHAGGFIISPEPLTDILPLFLPERKNDASATQWDMYAVEALGLVKYDFLAVKALDVIKSGLRMAGVSLPEGTTDKNTYDLLRSSNTIGVFQLDGQGMRGLLKRLGPRTFGDIAACIALYRPGPMGAGAHHKYADRANHREMVSYPHPEFESPLRDILAPTYGVIVYQEQVMQCLQRVCGYSLSEADLVRKAMGKKNRELLDSMHESYLEGGLNNGHSQEALKTLWDVLVPFADYSFGKGHAVGYGYLAYWSAWLKANHPKEHMAAVLSLEDDTEKQTEYITEARRMGIRILPPSVNESLVSWTPTEKGIRYGAASIKGVGAKVVEPLIKLAPYRSWADFLRRTPASVRNAGVVKALIESGGMDCLGSREGLLSVYERHLRDAATERGEIKRGEVGFNKRTYRVPNVDTDYVARAGQEIGTLGVALSAAPATFRVPHNLGGDDWSYVRSAIDACPGEASITFTCGPWEMSPDLQANPSNLARSLAPLGIVMVD